MVLEEFLENRLRLIRRRASDTKSPPRRMKMTLSCTTKPPHPVAGRHRILSSPASGRARTATTPRTRLPIQAKPFSSPMTARRHRQDRPGPGLMVPMPDGTGRADSACNSPHELPHPALDPSQGFLHLAAASGLRWLTGQFP